MRTALVKVFTVLMVALLASVSVLAANVPAADAQGYPPAAPQPQGPGSESGDTILAGIQANNLAQEAAAAAARGDVAAANAAANQAAAIAKANPRSELAQTAAAAAKASAAAARSANNASVPATATASPRLAFTGGDVNLPIALGAALIGSGGLVLLAANKRSRREN